MWMRKGTSSMVERYVGPMGYSDPEEDRLENNPNPHLQDEEALVGDYRIPTQASGNSVENRAAAALREGTVPLEEEEKSGPSRRKVVFTALALTAALLAGGGYTAVRAIKSDSNNLPPSETPVATAPQVPGETATTTPEKIVTEETVEFNVNGKTVTGIMTKTGIVAELGVFRDNVESPKAGTKAEGQQVLKESWGALKEVANMEVQPGEEGFRTKATDIILFGEGNSSALRSWVLDIQTKGSKILSIGPKEGSKDGGLYGEPDPIYLAQGEAYATVQDKEGNVKTYYVSAAWLNNSGIVNADPITNRVELREPK